MKRPREWLRSNQGVGFILTLVLVAFLVYLELSPWVHREVRDGFTLGFSAIGIRLPPGILSGILPF